MRTDLVSRWSRRVAPSPGTVILWLTTKRIARSAALWGYVFGAFVASSALSYNQIYKTPEERARLAATFGSNHGARALFGPAPQLQTVAGFTVYKVSMTITVIGAVWGLLTSTRMLRGDEDAGRWEMLLTGQTTRKAAVVQALGGFAAGVVILWAVTAVIAAIVGRPSKVDIAVGAALYFALALVSSAAMFLAVGAVTSQLAPTRRQAAGYGAVLLGASYALRMVADAGAGLDWLVWLSPLGWVERLQPLTAPRPWALVPIGGFTIAAAATSVYLAGRRDVGAGMVPDRSTSAPRLRLLSGPTGLTVRLTRSTMISWTVAIALSGLVMGLVARAAGSTIVGSSVQQVLSRLGASGLGTDAYLGVAFLLMAILLAFEAAGQVGAARAEEAAGRLDHILVAPVGRSTWLGGRLLVALAALTVGGVTAGLFAWAGAALEHSGVSFTSLLGAGVNLVPAAVLFLGIGILGIGLWPRRALTVVYVLLGWSVLIDFVGGFFAQNRWVLDTSVFHHVASAPAVAPRWVANGVMAGIGVAAMLIGDRAFNRRDLLGE